MNRKNIILLCFIILSTISLIVFPIENIKVSGNKIYLNEKLNYNYIEMQSNQNLNKTNTINRINNDNGYTLFSPLSSKKTYLIDDKGEVVHTWEGEYTPGLSAYLIDNGSILRSGRDTLALLPGGGHIQKITWANEIVWDFTFIGDDYIQHHDFKPLPNGNIFLIAWEFKTNNEAVQAGRAGTLQQDTIQSEFIVEIKPTGPTSGEIVWEWHAWDHIIQDYDSTKDNYGIVKDNPRLLDINYLKPEVKDYDWIHMNSIDYNQELDQILLTTRNFDEIWIIDHSTTITEASGHTGGKYNMGGDLLYRWGNPLTYQGGTKNDQKLFSPHDATWIEKGCPGENNILVYNNENSSVEEIVPPIDENGFYNKITNQPYEPQNPIWSYQNPILSSWLCCGTQRLPNGNTLICNGPIGYFLEVTPDKKIVWQYSNPYDLKAVDKIHRYYEIFSSSNPPELLKIYGPNKGIKGINYNFTISATDPENDDVFYMIDWGDGKNTGWIGEFKSSENITISHIWEKTGTYVIKMKAKDIHDVESDWVTLEIKMSKTSNAVSQKFLLRIFEKIHFLFPFFKGISTFIQL